MNCPIDGTELLITHRNDVELDYCPKCRGVWLDRGELDKIVEQYSLANQPASQPDRVRREDWRYEDDDKRRKSREKPNPMTLLEDLFNF